jgi:hypothetical protein
VASKERRFSDNDEIRFCLWSIRHHASWVRTIWQVTDNQFPSAIDRRKAEQHDIRVVDHREIFRGHEQLLPTFNSLAIETMLWRIDALADRFLLPQRRHDVRRTRTTGGFFSNEGKVTLRGRWTSWPSSWRRTRSSATANCWALKCWATPRTISSRPTK